MTASIIVFFYRYLLSDVILVDSEFLLHTDLHRQSVGIPACTAVYLEAALGLVPADGILDGTRHNMVNTRHSVCRRRSLEENELRSAFSKFE